jgi:hypothetical protein
VKQPVSIRTWRMPIVLAAITAFGVLAALFVDGTSDAAGWVPLAVPLVVVAWFVSPRVQRRRAALAFTPSPRPALDSRKPKEVH